MPGARAEPKLQQVAQGVHAYLQQGSWGFSNAGLVSDGEASLLVDTLFDLRLTERMLSEMRRQVPAAARIDTLVNTHANGDHCWGNQLVEGARIVSSRATAEEMLELSPKLMQTLVSSASGIARLGAVPRRMLALLGRLGVPRLGPLTEAADFVQDCFGAFDFRGIRLTLPDRLFDGQLDLHVGDRHVQLLEVGPAHTRGDVIVHLPAERVVFTGDILFIGSHPIAWEGPIANWIAACDRLLALDVDVVVPGHGPLGDRAGVQQTRDYWQYILDAAHAGHAAGAPPDEVARQLIGERYADWGEAHRLVVNLDTVYRELDGRRDPRDPVDLFARMARLERSRGAR